MMRTHSPNRNTIERLIMIDLCIYGEVDLYQFWLKYQYDPISVGSVIKSVSEMIHLDLNGTILITNTDSRKSIARHGFSLFGKTDRDWANPDVCRNLPLSQVSKPRKPRMGEQKIVEYIPEQL